MKFYDRDYKTRCEMRSRRAAGQKIIDLTYGDPTEGTFGLSPPQHVVELPAEIKALKYRYYGYTPTLGIPELRQAIVDDYAARYYCALNLNQVVITSGCTHATYLAMQDVIHHRRAERSERPNAILLAPYYPFHTGQLRRSGFAVKEVTCLPIDSDAVFLNSLESAIDRDTHILVVCSPVNPTGEILSEVALRGVLALMDERPNLRVISDILYDRIVGPNSQVLTLFQLASDAQRARIYVVSGISKNYAYPAERAGWLVTGSENIGEIYKDLGSNYGAASIGAQLAALSALTLTDSLTPKYFEENNAIYRKRMQYVTDQLNNVQGIHCRMPEAAFYIFVDLSEVVDDVPALVGTLLENRGVAVSVGHEYGAPQSLRIPCTAPLQDLHLACTAMIEEMQRLKTNLAVSPLLPAPEPEMRNEGYR